MERKTASGMIRILLMIAISTSMFDFHLVKATPTLTITINADGTIHPSDSPIVADGDIYTFLGNITYPTYWGIRVNRSNTIIDGAGYVVEGNGTGKGFELDRISNVTIRNTNIRSFRYGVYLLLAIDITVSENNITNNKYGIGLYASSNYNNILGNNITNNDDFGLGLSFSSNNVLSRNMLNDNKYNLYVGGNKLSHFMQSIDDSNLVGGKPVYYLVNQTSFSINPSTQVGFLGLINCDNVTVVGLTLTNNRQGLLLASTNSSRFTDNTITSNYFGIWLFSSFNNQFSENNITANGDGIVLDDLSNYNDISRNNITANGDGIVLDDLSNYNDISRNNITANSYDGIALYGSSDYNVISENRIANNAVGIGLVESSHNSIFGNNITNSKFLAIEIDKSSNNRFFHNNFIDNAEQQVEIITPNYANDWDDGFPSGGNYWSDYEKWYPEANELADSGIWDTPYSIDEDNQDSYPLMEPYSPSYTLMISSLPAGVRFTVDDMSRITPLSGTYCENISVSLIMPEIHTIGDARYYWYKWSDGNISRSRTVIMDVDILLTAQYTGPYYQLTVTSSPITEIAFAIEGVLQTTPHTEWILEGSYTLEMPETHEGYDWSHWLEDEDASRVKSVTMDRSITLTGVFEDVTPPAISIHFPRNRTYSESNVPLLFVVSEPTSWVGYSLDNQMNVTIYGNTTVSDLSNRIHAITVYANDSAGNMGLSDTVYFTVDTSIPDTFPPTVLIFSPKNKTYTTTDIPLTVEVDETVTWMAYSLDDQTNMTFNGTTTLSGLSEGSHKLVVYANDTAGNMGFSDAIWFTVNAHQQPKLFPIWSASAAVIMIVGVFGTALYLLKIRKKD